MRLTPRGSSCAAQRTRSLYRYAPAEPAIIAKAQRVAEVCRRHAVPLAAAALQFPLGHRSVVSVIPGPVAAEEVRLNLAWMPRDLPDALWAELKAEGLVRAEAPTTAFLAGSP